MPERRKAYLTVEIELDDVPGAFHTIESAVDHVQIILDHQVGHYNPKVSQTL